VTILVIGRSGQVAQSLSDLADELGLACVFAGRESCNLADTSSIIGIIKQLKPRAIINAAAYTAVDAAETDLESARAINEIGPAVAAKAAADLGIAFVHISTDYVFDGTKESPYFESDPTNPINAYGRTKRDGEIAILSNNADALILRTSWVYSPVGKNFLRTMLTLASTRDALSIVDDQVGAPTAARDIAKACLSLVEAKRAGHTGQGVFHMTGSGQTSWRGFAEEAFHQTAAWRGGKVPIVTPILTSQYPTPAKRPLNSRLNCDALEAQFGIRLPHWETSLKTTLSALENEFGVAS
jgi:dTDP-4-dehydrorhamnose reductase